MAIRGQASESSCLGVQLKGGGKEHRRLNMSERPIADKYCEGKMKRTLKRELKGLEIVEREALGGEERPGLARPGVCRVAGCGLLRRSGERNSTGRWPGNRVLVQGGSWSRGRKRVRDEERQCRAAGMRAAE